MPGMVIGRRKVTDLHCLISDFSIWVVEVVSGALEGASEGASEVVFGGEAFL